MKCMQNLESVVLTGTEWSSLRYHDILSDSLSMFTVNLDGTGHKDFEIGKDYEVDFKAGKIRRTDTSRIGNYADSPFYGCEIFNHEPYNGQWGNYPFMVYVSYEFESDTNILTCDEAKKITLTGGYSGICGMPFFKKLLSGKEINYTVCGDSISTGCEAILKEHAYFMRFADKLERITDGKVNVINKAVGGENSTAGAAHFLSDIEDSKPDLVTIAYGVNDMCVHGESQSSPSEVSAEKFHENIIFMIETAQKSGADVILITNVIPNPCWKFTSANAGDYPQEMRKIAKQYKLPLADNWKLWENELKHGKTLHDLLLNDVNHPTSYGHGLYSQMLFTLI